MTVAECSNFILMKNTLHLVTAAIFFAALCAACHKNVNSPTLSDSRLRVTADISTGSVSNGQSPDTFLVAMKDPRKAYRVPLVLHIAATSKSREGTRIDDSTYYDTVDISRNKVAAITVIAANGDSTTYGVAIPYIISNYTFNNWKIGSNGPIASPVSAVYVSGNTIYAGTYGGICISTNGGANFTTYTTANGLGDNQVNGITVQGGTIYAATNGGLSISTDGGSHFTNYTTANGLGYNIVYGVVVTGNTIYAATYYGISISSDGGHTFTNYGKTAGIPAYPVIGVAVSGNSIYAATVEGLSISANGGVTFDDTLTTSQGLGNNQVNAVYVQGPQIFAATLGGFSYSDNGRLFTNSTIGLDAPDIYCAYISGTSIYLGIPDGVAISNRNGTTSNFSVYNVTNGVGVSPTYSVFEQGNIIYAGTGNDLTVFTPR
jgi:hypothetical protein